MDVAELRAALVPHFSAQGFEEREDESLALDLLMRKNGESWGLVLCPDREEGMAYLGAFEAAMQRIIDVKQKNVGNLQLGLGIAFASTAQGNSPSYRRALKKYSNSIVFEDLDLHLLLVTGEKAIDVLKPAEVNLFLLDLDKWIAARKQ